MDLDNNIVISFEAKNDLDNIFKYLDEVADRFVLESFYNDLVDIFVTIKKFPNIGKLVENRFLKRKYIRVYLFRNYSIYYRKSKSNVEIIKIIHNKRLKPIIKI